MWKYAQIFEGRMLLTQKTYWQVHFVHKKQQGNAREIFSLQESICSTMVVIVVMMVMVAVMVMMVVIVVMMVMTVMTVMMVIVMVVVMAKKYSSEFEGLASY